MWGPKQYSMSSWNSGRLLLVVSSREHSKLSQLSLNNYFTLSNGGECARQPPAADASLFTVHFYILQKAARGCGRACVVRTLESVFVCLFCSHRSAFYFLVNVHTEVYFPRSVMPVSMFTPKCILLPERVVESSMLCHTPTCILLPERVVESSLLCQCQCSHRSTFYFLRALQSVVTEVYFTSWARCKLESNVMPKCSH